MNILKKDNPPNPTNSSQKILNKVAEFYHHALIEDQKAKSYLKTKFRINNFSLFVKNKIGYANGSLLKTLPEHGPIVESLKEAGILNDNAKEIHLDSLIIPELDIHGNALKITGKKLDELELEDLKPYIQEEPTTIDGRPDEYIEYQKDGLFIRYSDRKYFIRGIDNSNHRQLKANIKAVNNTRFHIDTIDLYLSKQRKVFAKETALLFHSEVDTTEQDLNKIIERMENYINNKKESVEKEYSITDKEREQALRFLKSPNLIQDILKDFETIGCAGEKDNKIMGYLAAVSRKLDDPLSLLILSRSAAGKSTLQDAILELVPEEDRAKYTRITGQALFYKGENSLMHKLIAIEEEEGASEASYSIRTMQSSKFLTIATTTKDPMTGQMKTMEYRVRGPLSIILTTTRNDIDPETMSRFIVLTIDETRDQTKLIHKIQRQQDTLEGLLYTVDKQSIIKKHHNAQRLLRPVKVVNPYAQHLTFADDRLRTRRDHKKYLNLIKAIAFLNQYQRPIKKKEHSGNAIEYIEVTLNDISFANILASEIFGRSLDELSPPSRRLLKIITEMVKTISETKGVLPTEVKFTRRDIRNYSKWSDHQVRDHLGQLVELEYIGIVGGRNGSRYSYELIYDGKGENGDKFVMGLVDLKTLRSKIPTLR